MPKQAAPSLATRFADRFKQARYELAKAPRPGARELPTIVGLSPNCTATVPVENVYAEATKILVESGKLFVYGDSVALEVGSEGSLSLERLTTGCDPLPCASALLANYISCKTGEPLPAYFPPPQKFVATLLARAPTREALPRIATYARRPLYDQNFVLRGAGFHVQQEILVHGPEIDPVVLDECNVDVPIIDRLPPHLRALLGGFCFKEPADVANGLAGLLTGALSNHFVRKPKASFAVDANQAGVGKTLYALAAGAVLDGELPDLIHFSTDDEELAKRILSNLRQRPSSVIIVDNAKNRAGGEISSPCIEANSMAPAVTLRILGKSVNYTQPNNLCWILTMNQTKLSPDLASRGMPIRLFYEGDPSERVFDGPNPLDYAIKYRVEILAELFGLVEHWKAHGRPLGSRTHRCEYWAQIIGGILETCGFPEFLGNASEAASEFSTELGDVAALAEASMRTGNTAAYVLLAGDMTGVIDE